MFIDVVTDNPNGLDSFLRCGIQHVITSAILKILNMSEAEPFAYFFNIVLLLRCILIILWWFVLYHPFNNFIETNS